MIDFHMHTARCGHATGSVGEYVEAGRRAGLTAMCFTDHLPLPDGYPAAYAMTWPELPLYVDDVRRAAADAASSGGPEVLCGIEADWLPGSAPLVDGAVRVHGFDVVLGSVHFVEGWAFDDPDLIGRWAEFEVEAVWTSYFEQLSEAASSGLFDVIAHPDLVKKFGFIPEGDLMPYYEEAAAVFAECGVAVEVNSAGLRKPVGEVYPSLAFLKALRARHVPVTMGSDAHAPDEVGAGLSRARDLIAAAGYDAVTVFRARVAHEVPL